MATNRNTRKRRLPERAVEPRESDAQPLEIEYFQHPEREDSFSSEVFRRLTGSPFFRPEMQADGSMTTKTLLTVAATVIAAADREIDKTQQIRERLVFWNAPLFQKPVIATEPRLNEAQDASQDENHASSEIAWFSKYLTLRNVLAVVVTATLTTWTIFNFVDTKNEHEVQNWKDKYTASQAELSAEHDRYDFIDKHSGELKTELDGVRSQLTQANSDLSAGKVDVQRLNDQAKTLNGQVKTLTNELTEANKRATTAEANLAAALKK